jgi:hypothetical protein
MDELMTGNEWLQNLKAGDKVLIEGSGLSKGTDLGVVSRFTNNFIVVKCGSFEYKFRKESGWEPGEGYYHRHLEEATPEALAAFEEERYRQVLRNKLDHLSWADVPIDRIKQIRELIEPYVRKREK